MPKAGRSLGDVPEESPGLNGKGRGLSHDLGYDLGLWFRGQGFYCLG